MPIYELKCEACGHQDEQILSVSAAMPDHCGQPMVRQLGTFAVAHSSRNRKLIFAASNSKQKGNRKPKTISRGNGLGGRRKPPTMDSIMSKRVKL